MDLPYLYTTPKPPKKSWERLTICLAHGAGAPMDSPFMAAMADGLAAHGFRVVRFEFPYMAARRTGGPKRPPDRAPVLLDRWRAVIAALGRDSLVIGGKSMGGRFASMVAADLEREGTPVRGLVCLGYPFHAPGQAPDKAEARIAHLRGLETPTLICQGSRDPFGTREQVPAYRLPPSIRLHWLEDGDHGFKPRQASGRTEAQNLAQAVDAMAAFLRSL